MWRLADLLGGGLAAGTLGLLLPPRVVQRRLALRQRRPLLLQPLCLLRQPLRLLLHSHRRGFACCGARSHAAAVSWQLRRRKDWKYTNEAIKHRFYLLSDEQCLRFAVGEVSGGFGSLQGSLPLGEDLFLGGQLLHCAVCYALAVSLESYRRV